MSYTNIHRAILFFLLLFFIAPMVKGAKEKRKFNVVTKVATAIAIADAVAVDLYGEAEIAPQRPFRAKKIGVLWVVNGVLPREVVGGVVEVHINSHDGRIVKIFHMQ